MAEILRNKCSDCSNVTIDVASSEDWIYTEDQKYDMIYSAQAFHWINKDIKYQKCYELLKDNGYLVLFWYNPSGHKFPVTIDIDDQVNRVVKKYTSKYFTNKEKPERMAHTGGLNNDESRLHVLQMPEQYILSIIKLHYLMKHCQEIILRFQRYLVV